MCCPQALVGIPQQNIRFKRLHVHNSVLEYRIPTRIGHCVAHVFLLILHSTFGPLVKLQVSNCCVYPRRHPNWTYKTETVKTIARNHVHHSGHHRDVPLEPWPGEHHFVWFDAGDCYPRKFQFFCNAASSACHPSIGTIFILLGAFKWYNQLVLDHYGKKHSYWCFKRMVLIHIQVHQTVAKRKVG